MEGRQNRGLIEVRLWRLLGYFVWLLYVPVSVTVEIRSRPDLYVMLLQLWLVDFKGMKLVGLKWMDVFCMNSSQDGHG